MNEAHETILVVDDSPETLELTRRFLGSEGYRVFTVGGVPEAIRLLGEQPVDLVITDLKMPKASGLDLIRHVRENLKDTEVIMITGYATIEGAVAAVKLGAEEYLAKPFTREELVAAVERSLGALRVRRAAGSGGPPASVLGLVGESEGMRRVQAALSREALLDGPVLLVGERGSGKEAVARALHYGGPRAEWGSPDLMDTSKAWDDPTQEAVQCRRGDHDAHIPESSSWKPSGRWSRGTARSPRWPGSWGSAPTCSASGSSSSSRTGRWPSRGRAG